MTGFTTRPDLCFHGVSMPGPPAPRRKAARAASPCKR